MNWCTRVSLRVLGTALAGVAFACSQAATSTPGQTWPNEPAGFTVVTDYGFGDVVPKGASQPIDSSGWKINNDSLVSRVADGSAPLSGPSVGQWKYPIGFLSGIEPGTMFYGPGGVTELYWGFWWKPSNPFQSDGSGVNKIVFFFTPSGNTDLLYFSLSPGPWHIKMQNDLYAGGGPSAGQFLEPNVTMTTVTLGAWHRIEIYVKYSTGSNANGIAKWWVDGALNGNFSNLKMSQDGGFTELQIAPTYGGNTGDRKTEDDYYWFDHLHISRGP